MTMIRFKKILKTDVELQTSHLWIVALGAVVGLGFLINCAVAPFYLPCVAIDSNELILSASIVAGLGTARQVVLYRFKYLHDLHPSQEKAKKQAEDILREKLWVPCVGWCLVFGYAVNMLIIPFFQNVRMVEWSFLQSSVAIFLTISGTREMGIYKQIDNHHEAKMQEKENPENA